MYEEQSNINSGTRDIAKNLYGLGKSKGGSRSVKIPWQPTTSYGIQYTSKVHTSVYEIYVYILLLLLLLTRDLY